MSDETKWSIIISALSAIATFAAVLVALWQTKYANRKKLKLKCSHHFERYGKEIPESETETPSFQYVADINICNVGNRKIIIKTFGMCVSKNVPIRLEMKNKQVEFPIHLSCEESITLSISSFQIRGNLKWIKNEKQKNPRMIPAFQPKKLRFYITDSTDKQYTVKPSKFIIKYIANR